MSEQDFPKRVTLYEDGFYRWSYDMDMYRNHYLRNILLKVLGWICLIGYLFLLMLIFDGGGRMNVVTCTLPFLGVMAFALACYYIAALVMHGTYRLRFEMDDQSICLVRKPSTQRMMNTMIGAAMLADSRVGHSLQSAEKNGYTKFESVRGFRERPEYDAMNLRVIMGANQIWVNPEDYEFVRDYIRSRLPERVRNKQAVPAKPWKRRLAVSCLASLGGNLAVMAANYIHYDKTYLPLLAWPSPRYGERELIAPGMRFHMTGFRGGGVLVNDIFLLALSVLACALIVFLLLTAFAAIRKYNRGE